MSRVEAIRRPVGWPGGPTERGAGLLPRPQDRLQISAAAPAHLLRCSLGQRPLRASSRVRASHLHRWRSPIFVVYPAVLAVSAARGGNRL